MASTPELAAMQRALGELRSHLGELRSRYGDVPPVRRIVNDMERFDIDLAELAELPEPSPGRAAGDQEVVEVPSEAYDESLWRGGDDEGVGGHHAER